MLGATRRATEAGRGDAPAREEEPDRSAAPDRSPSPREATTRLPSLIFLTPLLLACSRLEATDQGEPFRVTHIRPANAEGVFLNERLVFYFSAELDPTSVTGASVDIRSEDGRPARGSFEVDFDEVRFLPAPVLDAGLSDGGYLPGTRYTVTLAGFPRPNGLRSAHGELLETTLLWSFSTVPVEDPLDRLVFEDRSQDEVGVLRLFPSSGRLGSVIGAEDSIYLACDKPIDPSSVRAETFRLTPRGSGERIPVRVRILENRDRPTAAPRPPSTRSSAPGEAWERERRACVLELTPVRRLSSRGEDFLANYFLRLDSGLDEEAPMPRDFGGRPVLLDAATGVLEIRLRDAGDAGRSEIREEFVDRELRSPVAVPGADGTASWDDSGRLTVRYPAAAGSGRDGHVQLDGRETRGDVEGQSIDLAPGATCRLDPGEGLALLRCQGRMTIRGSLSRETRWDAQREVERDPTLLAWLKQMPGRRKLPDDAQQLSDWLADARREGRSWTVLLAGGDLVIEGSVRSSTPLLLVAGGAIRIAGSVESPRERVTIPGGSGPSADAHTTEVGGVFRLGEGGGPLSVVLRAPLRIDEPRDENPLVAPLRFAALSVPVPPRGRVARWLPPQAGGGPPTEDDAAEKRWRVRYVREFANPPLEPQDLHAVDRPELLDPPGQIRFLVELDVEPGGVWDPPWVDYVHLSWELSEPEPR